MITPSPLWNAEPATRELFRRRISRLKVPCAVREKSSLVAASLRNSVPRSAFVSFAMISTRVASRSSRLSIAATRWESLMSISVRRSRVRRLEMLSRTGASDGGRDADFGATLAEDDFALAGMLFLQLVAQPRNGAAELAEFILVRPGLFLELFRVLLPEPLQF